MRFVESLGIEIHARWRGVGHSISLQLANELHHLETRIERTAARHTRVSDLRWDRQLSSEADLFDVLAHAHDGGGRFHAQCGHVPEELELKPLTQL